METGCVREPDASYQCGEARFVNVMTDWKSNSSRIHRGKECGPGMNSSSQISDEVFYECPKEKSEF